MPPRLCLVTELEMSWEQSWEMLGVLMCSGWEGTGDAEGPSPLLLSPGSTALPRHPLGFAKRLKDKGLPKEPPPPQGWHTPAAPDKSLREGL